MHVILFIYLFCYCVILHKRRQTTHTKHYIKQKTGTFFQFLFITFFQWQSLWGQPPRGLHHLHRQVVDRLLERKEKCVRVL